MGEMAEMYDAEPPDDDFDDDDGDEDAAQSQRYWSVKLCSRAPAKLFAALAKAQAEVEGAAKDSTNPHFKSRYADLSSIADACRAALAGHGIAVVQSPSTSTRDGVRSVCVTTMLCHESGEWLQGTLTMEVQDLRPQTVGSAITYARRYSLAAFAFVAPEDDDGNAAHGRAANNGATQNRQEQVLALTNDTDISIEKGIVALGLKKDEAMAMCRKVTGKDFSTLNEDDGLKLLTELRAEYDKRRGGKAA